MKEQLQEIIEQTRDLDAQALLAYIVSRLGGRVALASALGIESQVLTDMLRQITPQPAVFTLDTGRLHQETYDLIDATRKRYGIRIEVLFPDRTDVEELVCQNGVNLFYDSIENRKACCRVRKVIPLRRKLAQLDAWITGLRREQSVTRQDLEVIQWDDANGLIKINPLANWTDEQVWEYIRDHNVPYNALNDHGYPSIGCVPCTRAVEPGQGIRAGRWWWEQPEHKECGLHVVDGKLTRKDGASWII
jgi:phosphoadenosine phosphosulfate reductase